uniref:Uncharacterized protein n=1 Tax=Mantoniella antarctica TaxID=81844 RepID=A0A7S0X3X4_9CHLO|mmetsp:Transcript_14925/g.36695  ORF Transcript_14925/g.36695 Transcript_14925/m.36695 type:complete len:123 (+) Transcript_14925:61-429(+)
MHERHTQTAPGFSIGCLIWVERTSAAAGTPRCGAARRRDAHKRTKQQERPTYSFQGGRDIDFSVKNFFPHPSSARTTRGGGPESKYRPFKVDVQTDSFTVRGCLLVRPFRSPSMHFVTGVKG